MRIIRRALRVVGVLSLGLGAVLLGGPAGLAAQSGVRTDPGQIAGYVVTTTGSPAGILFFEPTVPIPTDPGQPQFEATMSHTLTTLSTGPQARALSSSTWPGPAFGDGFRTICECEEDWRVKADARYPGPDAEQDITVEMPNGGGMHSQALGLDVRAEADASDSPNADLMGFGNAASVSTSTVVGGEAVAHLDAATEDISLLGGIITIDSISTTLHARTDAERARTSGRTAVNGLVVAGNGYTLDQNGLQPIEGDEPGDPVIPPLPGDVPGEQQLAEELGISFEMLAHEESVVGADASRKASGVRISIASRVLRQALNEPLSPVIDLIPEDIRSEIYTLLVFAPRIDFVFGKGSVRAAGVPPFVFPPIPSPTFPPPTFGPTPTLTPEPSPTPQPTPTTGGVGLFIPPVLPPPIAPVEQPPVVAAPTLAPVAAPIELFDGVPPAIVAAALLVAGLGAFGLSKLGFFAMAGAGAGVCPRGLPQRAPDLK